MRRKYCYKGGGGKSTRGRRRLSSERENENMPVWACVINKQTNKFKAPANMWMD